MPDLRRFAPADRDNDPQAIIALAVAWEGVPVRSWIFPGNTSDVTTVTRINDDLRGMRLGRTLFVGVAGMYSAANLSYEAICAIVQNLTGILGVMIPHRFLRSLEFHCSLVPKRRCDIR